VLWIGQGAGVVCGIDCGARGVKALEHGVRRPGNLMFAEDNSPPANEIANNRLGERTRVAGAGRAVAAAIVHGGK